MQVEHNVFHTYDSLPKPNNPNPWDEFDDLADVNNCVSERVSVS
jgi:hypothetical protein